MILRGVDDAESHSKSSGAGGTQHQKINWSTILNKRPIGPGSYRDFLANFDPFLVDFEFFVVFWGVGGSGMV